LDGLSCWDLNGNRVADASEDQNGDGNVDALDCQGSQGEAGAVGLDGLSCWDLNGNRVADAYEDQNEDGNFDALDCKGPQGETGEQGQQGPPGPQGPSSDGSTPTMAAIPDEWDGIPLIFPQAPSGTGSHGGSADTRTYFLDLDGILIPLAAIGGGNATGQVVTFASGGTSPPEKSINSVGYQDIVLVVDQSTPLGQNPLLGWLQATFNPANLAAQYHSGAVVTADPSGNEAERLEFTNALIINVTLPPLDKSNGEQMWMLLRLAPQSTQVVNGDGNQLSQVVPKDSVPWLVSDFELQLQDIPDMDVMRMSPLSFNRPPSGVTPSPYLTVEDVTLTVSAVDGQELRNWFDSFVIGGNLNQEKSGSLRLLDQTLSNELFRWNLSNIGIFAIGEVTPLWEGDLDGGMDASLYIEQAVPSS
jgi:hypothetical protein